MRLQREQEAMGYSMGEMAACLGIPKPTWQGYATGRRRCPYAILRQVVRIRRADRKFFNELPARVDARIEREFPFGIPSETEKFDHENFS